jgi:hypothetical protein
MRTINLNNLELTRDKSSSFLKDDIASGVSSFDVDSIVGFAVNQLLLITEPGNEDVEIVKTHATTVPTGNTITLAAATQFAHSQGMKVYIIDWDQAEFSYGSGTTPTVVLDTISLQVQQTETNYTDTVYSSGNYFIRFKNSITGEFSDYTDPIPWGGYTEDSVGAIINYALKRNKTEFTENVDHNFCINEINACLKIIRGKLKKWHSLQSFGYSLGTTSRGINKFTLPSNMWQYSNKSVLAVRIGLGEPLTYKDQIEWDEEMYGVAQTTLAANALIGATSITLLSTDDFTDSGTVMIKGQEITYTAIDRTTKIISGIPATGTGSITANLTSGDVIWQGDYEEGEPSIFNVSDGELRIWPMPSASEVNRGVILDYWKEAPTVDTDGDKLDIARFDMVKYWLTWAIRAQLKNDGMRDTSDGDYALFGEGLNDAIKIELRTHGNKYKTSPSLNQINF